MTGPSSEIERPARVATGGEGQGAAVVRRPAADPGACRGRARTRQGTTVTATLWGSTSPVAVSNTPKFTRSVPTNPGLGR